MVASATPIPPEPKKPFAPRVWLPLLSGIGAIAALVVASILLPAWQALQVACLAVFALSVAYFFVQTVARLATKRWRNALFAFLRLAVLVLLVFPAMGLLLISSMFGPSEDGSSLFGPSEDGFADHLTIPEGIEIAEPENDAAGKRRGRGMERGGLQGHGRHAARGESRAPRPRRQRSFVHALDAFAAARFDRSSR